MTIPREITNSEDTIDSRDIIERIGWLEIDTESDSDEAEELEALKALADEASGFDDWEYGLTLIRDSYFETYAQELADELGAVPADASWPLTCIDWEQAARELQGDYSAVEFAGVTYWARS